MNDRQLREPRDELQYLNRALATVNLAMGDLPDPADLADPSALTLLSDRGLLQLDRYRVARDPSDLAHAISDLTAVSPASHHVDWPYWCYELGSAHLVRMAETSDDAADDVRIPELMDMVEQSITWLAKAYGADHPEVNRHVIANELAELHWQLYTSRRYGSDRLRHSDRLIMTLHQLRVPDEDTVHCDIWRMHLGTAYEDRFGFTANRADLDLAIELLSSTVDRLSMAVLLLPNAYQSLARAYQGHYELDGDRASLDRWVDVTAGGADRTGPDPDAQRHLRWMHVQALQARLQRIDDPADRDRAIDTMRGLITADSDAVHPDAVHPDDVGDLADLLLDRGRDDRSEVDLLAAAHWYGIAADRTPDDDELKWLLHVRTADAYRIHRMLSGSVANLVPMIGALTAALALGVPDPDLRVTAHDQLVTAFDLLCDLRVEPAELIE